jgi:hypothetical protein
MPVDEEFLLYPLDTGEDPACLACGNTMLLAAHEAREGRPDLSPSDARVAANRRSLFVRNKRGCARQAGRTALAGARAGFSRRRFRARFAKLI